MKEKRSAAEIELGEKLKKAIDEADEELDFFKRMTRTEMPPPETFMVGKPNSACRRRRCIMVGMAICVAVVIAYVILRS